MLIIHADGRSPTNLEPNKKITIGISEGALVFGSGSMQAVLIGIDERSCQVQAYGMIVKVNEDRIRNGATVTMEVGDILKIGPHTIRIQTPVVHDTGFHLSFPGAEPRSEGPPVARAEPTYSSEALEAPTPTLVPAPNRPESDVDPPTERRDRGYQDTDAETPAKVEVEVSIEQVAPPGMEEIFAILENSMKRRIKEAFQKLRRHNQRELEAAKTTMLDTVGAATSAMREELDDLSSYPRLVKTASIVVIFTSLIWAYKTISTDGPARAVPETTDPARVVAEPALAEATLEPPSQSVVAYDVRESEIEAPVLESESPPFEPRPAPVLVSAPTGPSFLDELLEEYAQVSALAPPPEVEPAPIIEPITLKLGQFDCNARGCDFWATDETGTYVWRGERIRDGACDNGEPCLTNRNGEKIPRSCLTRSRHPTTGNCPSFEVIARIE